MTHKVSNHYFKQKINTDIKDMNKRLADIYKINKETSDIKAKLGLGAAPRNFKLPKDLRYPPGKETPTDNTVNDAVKNIEQNGADFIRSIAGTTKGIGDIFASSETSESLRKYVENEKTKFDNCLKKLEEPAEQLKKLFQGFKDVKGGTVGTDFL
jgi:hypothetical protein